MPHRHIVVSAVLTLLLLGSARPAGADVLLTPLLGITFAADAPSQRLNVGVNLAFLARDVVGVELDATVTPNFFDSYSRALEGGNMSTVMANVMLAAPMRGARIRPYTSAGAGLMRVRATSVGRAFELDESHLGVDIGAGAMGFMQDNIGVRGDVRYFRALQGSDADSGVDLGTLSFWRGTLGVTFRF